MKNLRRSIQGTIRRGNVVHGIVEDYCFGRASVRLSEGGSRLSNLSTLGYAVGVGDEVIVDYRAGVAPIVRPIFESGVEDEEVIALAVAEPLRDTSEAEPGYELIGDKVKDIDCGLGWEHNVYQCQNPVIDYNECTCPPSTYGQMVSPQDTDVFITFGRPYYHQWPWENEIIPVHMVYDTTNAFPETDFPGPDHIYTTLGGKYILWSWMGWEDAFGTGFRKGEYGNEEDEYILPYDTTDFTIKFWKNGNVVARNSIRCDEHDILSEDYKDMSATHQLTAIVDCDPGDIIQMSISQDMWSSYTDTGMHENGFWYYDWEGFIGIVYDSYILFTLQLIPQTQRS